MKRNQKNRNPVDGKRDEETLLSETLVKWSERGLPAQKHEDEGRRESCDFHLIIDWMTGITATNLTINYPCKHLLSIPNKHHNSARTNL